MKTKFIVFLLGFLFGGCFLGLHQAHATAYGQVTISTPSSGASYSSSSNVSTSVSWASTSTSGLYLDRRVFLSSGAAITSVPNTIAGWSRKNQKNSCN